MAVRRFYINPSISLKAQFERSRNLTTYSDIVGHNHTCRESLINGVWRAIELFPTYRTTGRGRLSIVLNFEVPSKTTNDEDGFEWDGAPTTLKAFQRLRDLKSKDAELCLLLLQLATATPTVLYSGIKALSGRPSSLGTPRKDWDSVANKIVLEHLTNCALQHPALLSVVLGQARWALEEFARGRMGALDRKLKLRSSWNRLLRAKKRGRLSPKDTLFVHKLMRDFITVSNTVSVNGYLNRYAVNSSFRQELFDFLRSKKFASIHEAWQSARIGNYGTIYSGLANYGFYKWVKDNIGGVEKKLAKVDKQQYHSLHNAYFVNG